MTALRLSPFQHAASFVGAILIAGTLFAGAAATAQTRPTSPTYRVELAQPAAERQVLAAGVIWTCEGTTCTAPRSNSRPAIVCARLAREAGTVARFSAGGDALPADQLARCNAAVN
jgi:hypothetical protein